MRRKRKKFDVVSMKHFIRTTRSRFERRSAAGIVIGCMAAAICFAVNPGACEAGFLSYDAWEELPVAGVEAYGSPGTSSSADSSKEQSGRQERDEVPPPQFVELPGDLSGLPHGSTGGMNSGVSGSGSQGPSQCAVIESAKITGGSMLAYVIRETDLFLLVPYLDGVFRPPQRRM